MLCILFCSLSLFCFSQSDGVINRIATSSSGRAVLDPNSDGYTSATTSGFLGNDVANSEIPYKVVQSFSVEPFGDLRRGPSHLYSDFVPDGGNDGFYAYYDGVNLLFRFRLGSVMSGSKGYSVLIDTDGKFGSTGTNADPNFQPATTGTNGNPGFEIEVVLETNFRIAVYNVDGASSPALVKSYTNWQDMSQVSVAGSNDNGDPDFFMDFYIPFSDLAAAPFNLTTSSSIRFSSTTVMSPQAAIGGPKSDIYGLTDGTYNNTNDQFTTYINTQCGSTITNLGSGGSGLCGMCTAPPVVNSPLSTGTVTVSGTWTASTLSGAATTATITVFKNGISVGTVSNITSGSSWSLSNVTVANNDIITAKAQGSGESMCLESNSVVAVGCNSSNIPSTSGFAITCNTNRGVEGTFSGTNTVKLYFISSSLVTSLLAGPSAASPAFGYSGSNWFYNGTNYNGAQIPSACSGGAPDMNNGTYYATTIASGSSCESTPVFACLGLSSTATPVITQTALYTSSTNVSGTATSGATVYLWVNGQQLSTTTATGGNYSFSSLKFNLGDVVMVRAITSGNCMSAAATLTVSCYTNPPLITADNNNQITAGQAISGTSGEATGTVIRVYNSSNTLLATTTVQADGTWSTGNAGTTPSTYTAVAGTSYYATAQNGTCSVSSSTGLVSAATATSSARCGTITGTPVSSSATSVSGTLTGSFTTTTVNLYLDDVLIGSTTTNNTNWGPITVNSTTNNTLYANGVLKIGVQESGKQEVICSSSATTITCTPAPVAPAYTPASAAINLNQTITYTITNAVSGYFYGVADAVTGKSYATGKWATSNGNLAITTNAFTSAGSYNIIIKATAISGVTVCSATGSPASVSVSGTLPLTLLSFTGNWENEKLKLSWVTEAENNVNRYELEKSGTSNNFSKIAGTAATGNNNGLKQFYSYTDASPFFPETRYRLKMVDEDGHYKYSPVITFKNKNPHHIIVSPNPFSDKINISYDSKINSALEVTITSISGKTLRTEVFVLNKGTNLLSIKNTESLSAGIYFIKLTDKADNSSSFIKVVK